MSGFYFYYYYINYKEVSQEYFNLKGEKNPAINNSEKTPHMNEYSTTL